MADLMVRVSGSDADVLRRLVRRNMSTPGGFRWPAQLRVVVDAHVGLSNPDIGAIARRAGVEFLVDPQTYLLQGEQYPAYPWARLPFATSIALRPSDLHSTASVDRLVASCLEFQLEAGASALLAPYVHIERRDSPWIGVQAHLWRSTARYLARSGIALDVVAPYGVGWRLLHPLAGRAALAPAEHALRDLAPREVAVAASKAHLGAHAQDSLVELLATVRRLSAHRPVLMWQQGHLGEACILAGAAGYEAGIGWREGCDLQTAVSAHRHPPGADDHPYARPVFVEGLQRSIPKPSLRALRERRGLWRDLICPDAECCLPAGEGLLGDARAHAVIRRATLLGALNAIQETQWRWNQLADRAQRALATAERVNRAAAEDTRVRRVDTTALRAIAAVAEHRRTSSLWRRPA